VGRIVGGENLVISTKRCREKEAGQVALIYIVSMVIVIAAIALLVDGGRYLVMRNRVRMLADASALSGANMLDIEEAQKGSFVLDAGSDELSAGYQAREIFDINKAASPEWADFQLAEVRVQGNEIRVTVTGSSAPLFGNQWGLNYSATIVSSARVATGISSER
jgi:hypothetical protein